jgi:hypothetical protein
VIEVGERASAIDRGCRNDRRERREILGGKPVARRCRCREIDDVDRRTRDALGRANLLAAHRDDLGRCLRGRGVEPARSQ